MEPSEPWFEDATSAAGGAAVEAPPAFAGQPPPPTGEQQDHLPPGDGGPADRIAQDDGQMSGRSGGFNEGYEDAAVEMEGHLPTEGEDVVPGHTAGDDDALAPQDIAVADGVAVAEEGEPMGGGLDDDQQACSGADSDDEQGADGDTKGDVQGTGSGDDGTPGSGGGHDEGLTPDLVRLPLSVWMAAYANARKISPPNFTSFVRTADADAHTERIAESGADDDDGAVAESVEFDNFEWMQMALAHFGIQLTVGSKATPSMDSAPDGAAQKPADGEACGFEPLSPAEITAVVTAAFVKTGSACPLIHEVVAAIPRPDLRWGIVLVAIEAGLLTSCVAKTTMEAVHDRSVFINGHGNLLSKTMTGAVAVFTNARVQLTPELSCFDKVRPLTPRDSRRSRGLGVRPVFAVTINVQRCLKRLQPWQTTEAMTLSEDVILVPTFDVAAATAAFAGSLYDCEETRAASGVQPSLHLPAFDAVSHLRLDNTPMLRDVSVDMWALQHHAPAAQHVEGFISFITAAALSSPHTVVSQDQPHLFLQTFSPTLTGQTRVCMRFAIAMDCDNVKRLTHRDVLELRATRGVNDRAARRKAMMRAVHGANFDVPQSQVQGVAHYSALLMKTHSTTFSVDEYLRRRLLFPLRSCEKGLRSVPKAIAIADPPPDIAPISSLPIIDAVPAPQAPSMATAAAPPTPQAQVQPPREAAKAPKNPSEGTVSQRAYCANIADLRAILDSVQPHSADVDQARFVEGLRKSGARLQDLYVAYTGGRPQVDGFRDKSDVGQGLANIHRTRYTQTVRRAVFTAAANCGFFTSKLYMSTTVIRITPEGRAAAERLMATAVRPVLEAHTSILNKPPSAFGFAAEVPAPDDAPSGVSAPAAPTPAPVSVPAPTPAPVAVVTAPAAAAPSNATALFDPSYGDNSSAFVTGKRYQAFVKKLWEIPTFARNEDSAIAPSLLAKTRPEVHRYQCELRLLVRTTIRWTHRFLQRSDSMTLMISRIPQGFSRTDRAPTLNGLIGINEIALYQNKKSSAIYLLVPPDWRSLVPPSAVANLEGLLGDYRKLAGTSGLPVPVPPDEAEAAPKKCCLEAAIEAIPSTAPVQAAAPPAAPPAAPRKSTPIFGKNGTEFAGVLLKPSVREGPAVRQALDPTLLLLGDRGRDTLQRLSQLPIGGVYGDPDSNIIAPDPAFPEDQLTPMENDALMLIRKAVRLGETFPKKGEISSMLAVRFKLVIGSKVNRDAVEQRLVSRGLISVCRFAEPKNFTLFYVPDAWEQVVPPARRPLLNNALMRFCGLASACAPVAPAPAPARAPAAVAAPAVRATVPMPTAGVAPSVVPIQPSVPAEAPPPTRKSIEDGLVKRLVLTASQAYDIRRVDLRRFHPDRSGQDPDAALCAPGSGSAPQLSPYATEAERHRTKVEREAMLVVRKMVLIGRRFPETKDVLSAVDERIPESTHIERSWGSTGGAYDDAPGRYDGSRRPRSGKSPRATLINDLIKQKLFDEVRIRDVVALVPIGWQVLLDDDLRSRAALKTALMEYATLFGLKPEVTPAQSAPPTQQPAAASYGTHASAPHQQGPSHTDAHEMLPPVTAPPVAAAPARPVMELAAPEHVKRWESFWAAQRSDGRWDHTTVARHNGSLDNVPPAPTHGELSSLLIEGTGDAKASDIAQLVAYLSHGAVLYNVAVGSREVAGANTTGYGVRGLAGRTVLLLTAQLGTAAAATQLRSALPPTMRVDAAAGAVLGVRTLTLRGESVLQLPFGALQAVFSQFGECVLGIVSGHTASADDAPKFPAAFGQAAVSAGPKYQRLGVPDSTAGGTEARPKITFSGRFAKRARDSDTAAAAPTEVADDRVVGDKTKADTDVVAVTFTDPQHGEADCRACLQAVQFSMASEWHCIASLASTETEGSAWRPSPDAL